MITETIMITETVMEMGKVKEMGNINTKGCSKSNFGQPFFHFFLLIYKHINSVV
jgi:hypothetical protein